MLHHRSITLQYLGILALGGVHSLWCWGFFIAFAFDDDGLFWEKLLFILMWTGHLLDWCHSSSQHKPIRQLTAWPIILLGLALCAAIGGWWLAKPSLMATSYLVAICAGLWLRRPGIQDPLPWLFLSSLSIITLPRWLVLYPIAPWLQELAAASGQVLLSTAGYEVWREGFTLFTTQTYLTVDSSCDGASALVLALATAVWSCLGQFSWKRLIKRLCLTVVWTLSLNIVRIIAVALAAHHGDSEWAFGPWHDLLGHMVYALSVAPLLWYSPLPDYWNRWLDYGLAYVSKLQKTADK